MIDVVDQQISKLHKIEWAPDLKTARTGSWVLDTGMTEDWAPSLSISRRDGITDGVGRLSSGDERGREHKIVSISNANLRFYDRRTLDGSNP